MKIVIIFIKTVNIIMLLYNNTEWEHYNRVGGIAVHLVHWLWHLDSLLARCHSVLPILGVSSTILLSVTFTYGCDLIPQTGVVCKGALLYSSQPVHNSLLGLHYLCCWHRERCSLSGQ